tara:strand:- start:1536 stop:2498 length:963 start_codon:yes stop_codon:yes gene_type:complete
MDFSSKKIIDIAKNVLEVESDALKNLSQHLPNCFPALVNSIYNCTGRVVISGIGKSGHIARKISATLASTGTPSYFIHATEASHGDLGMIVEGDICILISNSGETSELKDILNHVKRFSIPFAAISSNPNSTLMKSANFPLNLPSHQEVCPIGMAPTTSTTMMLALGDALAVNLMHQRNFNVDQYKVFHPGGKLGAQMLRIKDLMHGKDKIPAVKPEMPMQEALLKMTSKGFGYAVVVSNNKVKGVISDGDLRRHINQLFNKKAGEIATLNPITVSQEIFASEAIKIMNDHKIGVLIITNSKNEPIGITHIQDLLRAGII